MIVIPVRIPDRAYNVHIGNVDVEETARLIVEALGSTTGIAVLVDGTLGQRSPRVPALIAAFEKAASGVPVRRFDLLGGEASKTLSQLERTTEWMASQGFDRGSAIIGVGGGATGDHSGFAASIYLRGIRFALCPTTLLAMVDASVGGKTAVDLPSGKNLVGAFHQPRCVVADLNFLQTLPRRERVAGLAEVVKCAYIADDSLLGILEPRAASLAAGDIDDDLATAIAAAVRVKADVVTEDEREAGRRAILNFGHTVGHALEAASGYDLLHGEAVSLGMMAALSLGASLGVTPPALHAHAGRLLSSLGLPIDFERRLNAQTIARIDVDKKRRGGAVRFVFVTAPGVTEMRDVSLDDLRTRLLGLSAER